MFRVLLLAVIVALASAAPAEAFGRKHRPQSAPCPCPPTCQRPYDPCNNDHSIRVIDGVVVVGKIPSHPPIEE